MLKTVKVQPDEGRGEAVHLASPKAGLGQAQLSLSLFSLRHHALPQPKY